MKIYNTKPEGNDVAEFVGSDYIKYARSSINDICSWMKETSDIAQPLLAHIELLLIIAKKYPVDANLMLKTPQIQEWKTVFNEWFERCKNSIPLEYRNCIKTTGDELFEELEQFGHSISWLGSE